MDETKPFYTSKGVWGGVVAMVLGILGAAGLDFSAEQDTIVDLFVQLGVIVAGLIALIGRLAAKSRIAKPPPTGYNPVLLIGLLFFAGCIPVGVRMSPRYARALEQSAIVVGELNTRCQEGDDLACKGGLRVASETLDLLVAGLHGKGADDESE